MCREAYASTNFHTLMKHSMSRSNWKKWNRVVVCIAGGHTVKSHYLNPSCCALPTLSSTHMLKSNTDAMILWQMISMAKDTTEAKAFSLLTHNALPREIESNRVILAASSACSYSC